MTHKELMQEYFSLVSKLQECSVGIGVSKMVLDFSKDPIIKSTMKIKLDQYEQEYQDTRASLDRLVASMAAKACE